VVVLDRRLVFTFGWAQYTAGEPLAPASTTVEVTLTADEDETLLVLCHFAVPPGHAPDHRQGWAYFVGGRLPVAATASRAL
jgi:hypothetical protein